MNRDEKMIYYNPVILEEYEKVFELLRGRVNVLNTSVFLLKDKMQAGDKKMENHISKINMEIEKIRLLLNNVQDIKNVFSNRKSVK